MTRVAEALEEHFGNSSVSQTKCNCAVRTQAKADSRHSCPDLLGELIDKITILQIKTQHLQDCSECQKRARSSRDNTDNLQLNIDNTAIQRLKKAIKISTEEDEIRDQERQRALAKPSLSWHGLSIKNDQRAAIKKDQHHLWLSPYGRKVIPEY